MLKHIFKALLNADLTNTNVAIPILEINDQSEILDNTLTDETQPSIDDSNQSFDAVPKRIERDEKKLELITRLALARKKIQSYKSSSDAEILIVPRISETLDQNTLNNYQHQHNSMNIQSDLKSGILYTQEYVKKLEEQLKDLYIAQNQV